MGSPPDAPVTNKLLIIGSGQDFISDVRTLLADRFQLLFATTERDGLAMARTERPDAVILGFLEPRGASYNLHKRLRKGWITKHIPLLVVDVVNPDKPQESWSPEEAMNMDAEDYIAVSSDETSSLSKLMDSIGLIEKISDKLQQKENPLKEAILDPDTFCVTWEQIPGRGAFEMQQEKVIENVAKAAEGGRIHALSVTDNPGGNPALSTEMLCAEIKKSGVEPLVHLACRDKNRNEIESMLYGIAAEGVRNVLLLTGDYPSGDAFAGRPKPVFDLDPVNALNLIEQMNNGLEHSVLGKTTTLAPTDFFAGVCVSQFKKLESELVGQYAKLKKKIEAGARFIVTQIGYDMRKLHELMTWLSVEQYDIPVLANIYVLPFGAAKVMNSNGIPGCVVTDKLLEEISEEKKADDKGKSARLERAAKQYAIAKGLGCAGAHIGGHGVSHRMVEQIVDRGEQLSGQWESLVEQFNYPQQDGFYYFEKDQQSGLNTAKPSDRNEKPRAPLVYRFSRLAHVLIFNNRSIFFKILRPIAARVDRSRRAKKLLDRVEHAIKAAMFGCKNCGDCGLFDVAFLCPMSQCPKEQRNGPCGGSFEGWCEVYPGEKQCVWVQAYLRLKRFHEEHEIEENVVPPCNWDLRDTSSWLNFYLGRDHSAHRLGILPPENRKDGKKHG